MNPGIRAVIFDIDGTLLDSNDAHARCFQKAFAEQGMGFEFDQIRRLIGMGSDHLIPVLAGLPEDSPEGKRISSRKKEIFMREELAGLRAFPKARELVAALRDRGLRIAVATSAKQDELEQFLRKVGIEDLLETETSSSDAPSSKPDPDVVQAALRKLGVRGDQAVMIGDTPYDIEAARKAGVATLALRSGGWAPQDLQGAIAIYRDPEDLLAHLDGVEILQRSAA